MQKLGPGLRGTWFRNNSGTIHAQALEASETIYTVKYFFSLPWKREAAVQVVPATNSANFATFWRKVLWSVEKKIKKV